MDKNTLLDEIADELVSNLNKNTSKEDAPIPGKQYALTGGTKDKCIANGNSWAESEVK